MTTAPVPKLLPCAFCGAEGATTMRNFSSVGRMDHHYLFCHGCGSCGPTGRNEDETIKAWNMRPAATHPEIRRITDDELIQFPTNLAALLIAALAEHAGEEESELIADANHYFMSAIRATPATEQPGTLKVSLKLARQLVSKDRTLRAAARSVLRDLLGKEGEA